ncbi:hypothetical protein NIA69_05160 [Gemmiger formicilis]|nr:hypothetical protein [Gemmiger formicilis]
MENGTAPEMLVTHFVWRYRGRQTLKGVGRNPYLGGTTDGATEKRCAAYRTAPRASGSCITASRTRRSWRCRPWRRPPWQLPSRQWRRRALCSWRSCCWTQRPTPARY